MTTSVWDEREIQKQFSDCQDLREIISRLERDFSTRGEVICEIRVNGLILHENDETRFAQSPVREISSLAIASERPEDLIRDAIVSALDYVPRVRVACESVAELFRGSDIHAAQKRFTEVLDGCQWLVDTIVSLRGAAQGIGRPIRLHERWSAAESQFSAVVTQILAAHQNQDHVLTADLVEYELNNVLEVWSQVLIAESAERILAR
ncbi:MAG: hypothetical protein NDI61_08245 [Bdellovibrionaceae bacterium]|nr:hypothetical protein [Pseudobdellovibrionaceae bacterium]